MNAKQAIWRGLLGLCVLAASGHAQSGIYVEYWNGSGWVHVVGHPDRLDSPPDPGYASGSDIDIVNATDVTYRVFAVSPSTTDIGDITINAPSNSVQPRLLVGRFNALTEPIVSQRLDAAGCRDLSSISSNLGKIRVQAWVKADILSGGIDTHEIVRLDVDGDVLGPISHRPVSGNPTLGMLRVIGNIDPASGGVVAFDGNIGTIRTVSGNLLCDVLCLDGDIGSIDVGGTIGTQASPVNVWCAGPIKFLACEDLYADLDTGKYGSPYPLYELYVESTDPDHGNFEGRIHCLYVSKIGDEGNGEILVTGNLTGDIDIDDDLAEDLTIGGVLDAAEPLTIGAQLKANGGVPSVVHFDNPQGLEGQIIINAIDADEEWNGIVQFAQLSGGPIALSPVPYYDNKSSTFGGGAVGLVPFNVHYRDCTPAGTKDDDDGTPDGVDDLEVCEEGYHAQRKGVSGTAVDGPIIRHYGRIGKAGTGKAFTVKEVAIADPVCTSGVENWTDVTASFTMTLHPSGDERAYEIDGPFMPGYDYLIEPKTTGSDYLYCDDLATTTVAVEEYDFRFRVFVLQDLSHNGLLQPDDISAWLADPKDTTLDGVTDNLDLIDVTEAVANSGD